STSALMTARHGSGYIEHDRSKASSFPYDLLRRRCGEPMESTEAEELLDTVGLQALGEQWLLRTEGDAWVPVGIQEFSREAVTVAPRLDDRAVAKAPDLTATVMLSLPTDRLRSAE
ncbi:hypothetical protein D9C01_12250, partial [Corynebacterium diphtheriae]